MHKVLAFGEILWDIIEGKPHLGGAPLNFAAHVKQCGLQSGIVSALGEDDFGNKALTAVEKLGIDTSFILQSEKPTGTVTVSLRSGQPDYDIIKDVAYDYIDVHELDHENIDTYDVFYFGTLAQRSEQSKEALFSILNGHSFSEIFYDVNLRKECFTGSNIAASLKYCSILKVNDEEVDVLAPMLYNHEMSFLEFCETIVNQNSNVKTIIITAGGDGCYIYTNGNLSLVSSEPITVADTVGAGDSFSAGFVTSYLKTGDALKSAEIANKIGGFVASQHGAIPAYSAEILQALGE